MEYHSWVRHWIPASFALCTLLALPVVLVSTSHAQSGAAASASFSGGGGHAAGGAGAASSGSHGSSSSSTTSSGTPSSGPHAGPHSNPPGESDHHPHHQGEYAGTVLYAVPFPYAGDDSAADNNDDANADADDDADYQGGPTVFDRRGLGAESYVPPVEDAPQPYPVANAYAKPADETPQRPTTLVFTDGHTMEVGNYAIVGETLFDLTPGHARRVALAQLDLERTRQENEDHGVVFELPSSPQAN